MSRADETDAKRRKRLLVWGDAQGVRMAAYAKAEREWAVAVRDPRRVLEAATAEAERIYIEALKTLDEPS